jgi:hypothetical protein
MLKRLFKGWLGMTVIAILCHSQAWAYEVQRSVIDDSLQRSSNSSGGMGFLLNFSQRYYDAVDNSLRQSSYYAFRYYLGSPFDSFDKRQFIYENPTQGNDIALRALHNALQQALVDVELVEYLRDRINDLTSFKMVIGADGTLLHGPSINRFGLKDSNQQADANKTSITSGLTFADDFRLGLAFTMTYHRIISKLRYYPASRNEIAYAVETQLTASTKVGMSFHRSDEGNNAVMTTLSLAF